MFFHTIRRFHEGLRMLRSPELVVTAGKVSREKQNEYLRRVRVQLICQVLLTVVMVSAGLYILLSGNYSDSLCEAASGWVGAVIGYWLR
jgi:hypothetical protein